MRSFDHAFAYLLGNEGVGYSDDSLDSGGPTKMGITQKAYSIYMGRPVSIEEIQNLTIEKAHLFYEESIWIPLQCYRMVSVPVAIAVFDSGTLFGIGTVGRIVQKTLIYLGVNVGPIDGIIGPTTVRCLNSYNPETFLDEFYINLMHRIDELVTKYPKNEKYRTGWERRVARISTVLTQNPEKYVIL